MDELLECICGLVQCADCFSGCDNCSMGCCAGKKNKLAKGDDTKDGGKSSGASQFAIPRCSCGYNLLNARGAICPQCDTIIAS